MRAYSSNDALCVVLAQTEKVKLSEGLRVREVQVLPNGKKRVYDEHDGNETRAKCVRTSVHTIWSICVQFEGYDPFLSRFFLFLFF